MRDLHIVEDDAPTLELMDEVTIRAVDGRGFSFPQGAGAAILAEVDGNQEEGLWAELEALD